jgi:hypothetical protein
MYFLQKATSTAIPTEHDGNPILQLPKFFMVFGFLALFGGVCGALYSLFLSENQATNMLFPAIMFLLMFSLPGVICLQWYYNYWTKFDNDTIEVSDWLGRITTIKWKDIESANFNAMTLLLLLKTPETTVKVYQLVKGFPMFVGTMEELTEFKAKELKIPR